MGPADTMKPHSDPNRRLALAHLAGLGLAATGLSACAGRDKAPESRFLLLDGTTVTTTDLRGRVLLVNFWATTCVSCVKEMPALVRTHQKYHAQGFETLAVAMQYDPPQWVLNFAQSRQLPFKVALDNTGELARDWGEVRLTPTTFLVDRQGTVVKRYVGEPEMDSLHRLLEKLLAQAA